MLFRTGLFLQVFLNFELDEDQVKLTLDKVTDFELFNDLLPHLKHLLWPLMCFFANFEVDSKRECLKFFADRTAIHFLLKHLELYSFQFIDCQCRKPFLKGTF